VLPRARRSTGRAGRLRRPAGGVLDTDHVRSGDDSIGVAHLVRENRPRSWCGLHRWQRGLRNGKSSVGTPDTVGPATGHTTNARSDRPTGRQERKTSGCQPEDLAGINPARFLLVSRRYEGRMARPFEQPRLASPRSISLLATRSTGALRTRDPCVMPPLARSGARGAFGSIRATRPPGQQLSDLVGSGNWRV
jgi:hypothetical protein